jgi:RHS repeat-associated protein
MVNVGTGNLLVAATDADLHEQGIDLAFQRVYNSQSLHDYNGDDGGNPAIFGNRWTNNYDANIVYDSNANTITVYDLDGTACTYTASAAAPGGWQPCTGEYATLIPTDQSDCTYAWYKPNGTVYWFHTDATGSGCGIQQAKQGHLQEVLARNQNNLLTFAYSYDSSGMTTSEHIAEIDVNHSDGDTLTMKFGIIPGTTINELATITLPDGVATLKYLYDNSGNLVEVDKPGNNSAFSLPNNPSGPQPPQGNLPETYAYASGSSTLQEVCGPRCTAAMWASPTAPADGGALLFTINASLLLRAWQFQGVLNFTPDDGTNTPLHPSQSTQFTTWYTANFVYGSGTDCGHTSGGATTMCDTDGHSTTWAINSSDQVTQTQEWAGTAKSLWLTTSQTWDANKNLASTTDANGNVTKYGYDNNNSLGFSCCGNMVEMQLPQSNDITNGPLAPLSFYSYDSYFNVVAYCDPVYNQNHGNSWVPSPGGQDNLCPLNANHATLMTYKYPAPEPYGCLSSVTKPTEYLTDISYPAGGPCGNGQPTKVQADQPITNYDGTVRQPTQNLAYDANGNLTNYDKGQSSGGAVQGSWTLSYNRDNRLVQKTNNDSQLQGTFTSMSCYYPDGSLFYTETPSQWANDGNPTCPSMQTMLSGLQSPPTHATAYYYDTDGNQKKMVTHKGCSGLNPCPGAQSITACASGKTEPIGTTCKYYDGLDRLVEVASPYDTRAFGPGVPYEFYNFRWMDRYVYDLSQNGGSANLSISDSTGSISGIVAYGALYKTQEYLPQPTNMLAVLSHGQYQTGIWNDIRGSSFDALNRTVNKYELAFDPGGAVTTNVYDCLSQLDLLCSATNSVSQTTTYSYDNIDRIKQIAFSGAAPLADGRTYTFDADGRQASASNSLGTLAYTYDVDGNRTSVIEPSGEGAASLICYAYYADGLRSYLGIGLTSDNCGSNTMGIPQRANPSNNGISQPKIFSYSYRNDGLTATQQVNWSTNAAQTFSWSYSPSGREMSQTDPLNNQKVLIPPNNTPPGVSLGIKQYQYDSYGRVNQVTYPEGYQETSITYDGADEIVERVANQPFLLNARGELIQQGTPPMTAQAITYMANGSQVGNGSTLIDNERYQAPPTTLQYDVRSGMAKAIANPQYVQDIGGVAWGYDYDSAGRQSKATDYPNWPTLSSPSPEGANSFDAENHLQQTTIGFGSLPPGTVGWGPDQRQRVNTTYTSLNQKIVTNAHWDGDNILFAGGSMLYIGKLAVMTISGDLEVLDRDETGNSQTEHGVSVSGTPFGNWYDSWSIGGVRSVQTYNPKANHPVNVLLATGSCGFYETYIPYTYYSCPQWAPPFAMKRTDGYAMIGGIVQGARTYDPTSGQWLTPDPYAGDVGSPMSQKPFVWNNNNPAQFEDPTGYVVDPGNDPTMLMMLNFLNQYSPTFQLMYWILSESPSTYHYVMNPNYSWTSLRGGGWDSSAKLTIDVGSIFTRHDNVAEIAHETGHALQTALAQQIDHTYSTGSDEDTASYWASRVMTELKDAGFDNNKIDAILQSGAIRYQGEQDSVIESQVNQIMSPGGTNNLTDVTEAIGNM